MNEICPCGPPFSTRPDTADMYVYRTAHMLPAFFVRHFHLGSLALWPPTVATFRTGSSIRNSPFAFRRRHKSFSSAKRQQQRQKQSTTSAKQKAGPKPNPQRALERPRPGCKAHAMFWRIRNIYGLYVMMPVDLADCLNCFWEWRTELFS